MRAMSQADACDSTPGARPRVTIDMETPFRPSDPLVRRRRRYSVPRPLSVAKPVTTDRGQHAKKSTSAAQTSPKDADEATERRCRVPLERRALAARFTPVRRSTHLLQLLPCAGTPHEAIVESRIDVVAANTLASPPRGLDLGLQPLDILTRIRRVGRA